MLTSDDGFLKYAFDDRSATEPSSSAERLAGDLNCDACVVGGGFAGLSSALHLAISGHDVVLLEKAWIGWGASGRNAGMVLPGFAADIAEIRQMLGSEHARRLWLLSVEGVNLVADLLKQYEI